MLSAPSSQRLLQAEGVQFQLPLYRAESGLRECELEHPYEKADQKSGPTFAGRPVVPQQALHLSDEESFHRHQGVRTNPQVHLVDVQQQQSRLNSPPNWVPRAQPPPAALLRRRPQAKELTQVAFLGAASRFPLREAFPVACP